MKTLNKTNTALLKLIDRANNLLDFDVNDDFNTREGKIVANIKVYEWLNEDDVDTTIKDMQLSKKQIKKVKKEFNEDRLWNVINHVNECEVSHLKEKYEQNVDLTDIKRKAFTYYSNYLKGENPEYDFYLEEFNKFKEREDNSPQHYFEYLKKEHKWEWEEWQRRDRINFECWQYGRSGGWFSICDVPDFGDSLDYYIYDVIDEITGRNDITDKEINKIIREEYEFGTKKEFISELKYFVKENETYLKTIKYYVDEIEGANKYYKSMLLEQLSYEIGEFVSNELDVKTVNATIKIEEDKIKTSLGVSVPLTEFKEAYKELISILDENKGKKKIKFRKRVGNFTTETIFVRKKDIIVKAGCHRISLNQVRTVLN